MKKILIGLSMVLSFSAFAGEIYYIGDAKQKNNISIEDLGKMKQVDLKENTPWFKEEKTFSGPLLKDVVEKIGAKKGQKLIFTSINDSYSVAVPVSDAYDYNVIMATKIDGVKLKIRDKGPAFIIYPFHSDKSLVAEKYFARSIWQIRKIEIVD